MTILGAPIEVPAPELIALAERLEAKAGELLKETRETEEWRLGHVGQSLAMLTVGVRNVADSGPRSHLASLQAIFPDQYAAGDWPKPERLRDQRALLDVVAVLSVGDMVLDDVAALVLGRERQVLGKYPWNQYMRLVDELARDEPPSREVKPARTLDLTLREARHRLVAHRLETQSAIFTYDRDNTLTPEMVNPAGMEEAYKLLRDANARLAVPLHKPEQYDYGHWAELVDWVVIAASSLDREGRDLVRRAFRAGSYAMVPVASIAESIVALVTAAAEHPIQPDAGQ